MKPRLRRESECRAQEVVPLDPVRVAEGQENGVRPWGLGLTRDGGEMKWVDGATDPNGIRGRVVSCA
jgi:hypothetical protein